MRSKILAPIADLYTIEGKAKLVSGEIADAEPAVPGWRMLVNDLFE